MEWLVVLPLWAIFLWFFLRRASPDHRGSTPVISIGIDHGEWLPTQLELLEERKSENPTRRKQWG